MNNTIAVIIVTYNAESYIENCLDSLKEQDFLKNWIIIVVDNKSTDNTLKIIIVYHKLRVVSIIPSLKYKVINVSS